MLRSTTLFACVAAASCQLASRWPAQPVADDDGSLFRSMQQRLGAKAAEIVTGARMLSENTEGAPPSYEDIAQYNIILFASIALLLITYFSFEALFNMEHMNDSLLYSKSKTD